jgi:hypothetical protein
MENEMTDMINFFLEKKITAHIDTDDGGFYNGLIIELHKTFLIINDRILGETPVQLSRIKVIERFRGKE